MWMHLDESDVHASQAVLKYMHVVLCLAKVHNGCMPRQKRSLPIIIIHA